MRIPCSTPVDVHVTVYDTWCKDSHPHDFGDDIGGAGPINGPFTPASVPPVTAGAHISPTVVYTHGASATPAWGEYATQGGACLLKMHLVWKILNNLLTLKNYQFRIIGPQTVVDIPQQASS